MSLSLSQSVFEPIRARAGRPHTSTFRRLGFRGSIQVLHHAASSHQHHRAIDQQSCAPSTPKSIFNRLKNCDNHKRFRMRHLYLPGPSQTQPPPTSLFVLSAAQSVSTNPDARLPQPPCLTLRLRHLNHITLSQWQEKTVRRPWKRRIHGGQPQLLCRIGLDTFILISSSRRIHRPLWNCSSSPVLSSIRRLHQGLLRHEEVRIVVMWRLIPI